MGVTCICYSTKKVITASYLTIFKNVIIILRREKMDYQTNEQENNTNATDSAQQTTSAQTQNGYNSQQYVQYNPQNYQQNGGQYNQQYTAQSYQQYNGQYNPQYASQSYQQNNGQYNQQYGNQSYQQDNGQYNQQYADQNYQQPGYNYAEQQQYGQQYTQPTDENTKPPKKHKKRNFLIVLAVLLIGVGIGFLVYRNSDAAILKSAFADLEDKVYDLEAVGAYKKVVENGKMTVTVGTDSEILGGQNLKVETWSNKKQRKSAIKLTSDYAEGSLYASTKGVYVQTNILDDAYGIEFKGMWDRFEQSELYDYLDADEYEAIISAIENITDDPEGFSDEIKKYVKKYSKELEKEIYKKAERENQNGVLTLTLDNKAVVEIVEDMYKKLKNDKDFQNYLDKTIPLDTISGISLDKWKEIFDEIEVDYLTSVIEQFDFEIELKVTYTSIKHGMKKLEINFSVSGDNVAATTLDFSEKDTITASVKASGTTLVKVKYSESKDGFKLTVDPYGGDQYNVTFNKLDNNKYKMKLKTTSYYGEEEIVLEGKYQSNGKHFLFNVDTVTLDDEETVVDITLEMTYKQSMPSFPSNTKDVMSLDEDDIDSIEEQIIDWSDEVSDEIMDDYMNGSYSAVSGTAAMTVIMAPTMLTAALALIG